MIAAVGQFCANAVASHNLTICKQLIQRAVQGGAKMVFLPEASDFIASSAQESCQLAHSGESAAFLSAIQEAAAKHNIWVSIGLHEAASETTLPSDASVDIIPKVYNTHWIINNMGEISGKYRKLHLFDVDIPGGPRLLESASTLRGDAIVPPVSTPIGKVGLAVCYDLRFPELSGRLRQLGADILTFPSAFTVHTGKAHWEVLLRARAIENQTFVIAAAQYGQHHPKRSSFGSAMIVDPWGTILARCPDSEEAQLAFANIDLAYLERIRANMPVAAHRRVDLFP